MIQLLDVAICTVSVRAGHSPLRPSQPEREGLPPSWSLLGDWAEESISQVRKKICPLYKIPGSEAVTDTERHHP